MHSTQVTRMYFVNEFLDIEQVMTSNNVVHLYSAVTLQNSLREVQQNFKIAIYLFCYLTSISREKYMQLVYN